MGNEYNLTEISEKENPAEKAIIEEYDIPEASLRLGKIKGKEMKEKRKCPVCNSERTRYCRKHDGGHRHCLNCTCIFL